MIFNSAAFFLFAFIFFGIYYFVPRKLRLIFLLFFSYLFYGWWDWRYLSLIFLSTIVDFTVAKWIERSQQAANSEKHGQQKLLLLLSIVTNLGILITFKYFNFFADSLREMFVLFNFKPDFVTLNVLLPVGISFYTFQSMGYTIDVYRQKIKAEKCFLTFSTYVAFFPQLVAGPIERPQQLIPQLKNLQFPTFQQVREGLGLIIWGYFLKVVIADNVARFVDLSFFVGREKLRHFSTNPDKPFIFTHDGLFPLLERLQLHLTAPEIIIILIAFSLQIYGDFCGYSRIARGLAKLVGIELMINFKQPYLAYSPSNFWQRWHISLSQWLRDYLYIPLGGSRSGTLMTFRNLVITMFLGGLWHGAAWTFVLWGVYHGFLLVGQRLLEMIKVLQKIPQWLLRFIQIPVMYALVCYGWLLFRAKDFKQVQYFTVQLFTYWQLPSEKDIESFQVHAFWVLLFLGIVLMTDILHEVKKRDCLLNFTKWYHFPIALILIILSFMLNGDVDQFIYFQF